MAFCIGLCCYSWSDPFTRSIFLPDMPTSAIEAGDCVKAKQLLLELRGVDNVDDEFNHLVQASENAKQAEHAWRNLFQRKYRLPLAFAVGIPVFQQLTGNNVIVFCAPVLPKTIGFEKNLSLSFSLAFAIINMLMTFVSIGTANKFRWRKPFLVGLILLLIGQVVMTTAVYYGMSEDPGPTPNSYTYVLAISICFFVTGFAWSDITWDRSRSKQSLSATF